MPSRYINSIPLLLDPQWIVQGYVFIGAGDAMLPSETKRIGRLPSDALLIASPQPHSPAAEFSPWPVCYSNDDGSPLAFLESHEGRILYIQLESFRASVDQSDDTPTWCVFRIAATRGQTHLCDD